MNRRTPLIAGGAALAVLLIWYLLLWSPQGKAIDKAKLRQQTAQGQVRELRARLSQLQEAQRNEAATRAKIEELRQAIPDEPNLAQFILDANDAAVRSGIDFLSISPTPPAAQTAAAPVPGAPASAPSQITLSLSITGGYFQLLDFVNRLNDLTRIVMIDGMNVGVGTGADLQVQLTGRMFTNQSPVGTAGAAGGAAGTPGATTTTTVAGATTTTVSSGGGQ